MEPRHLFERLSAALASATPSARESLTIGDVYQRHIPYRTIRNELGVMELAAYEHALLRLLAGEGGFLEVDNALAVEEFRRELASVNPILGVYRDYADVRVRLSGPPGGLEGPVEEEETFVASGAPPAGAVPLVPLPESGAAAEPKPPAAATAGVADSFQPALSRPPLPPDTSPNPPRAQGRPDRCECCGEVIPALPGVRFCPYCGEARPRRPCAGCGTLLEPDWKFCIRCGHPPAGAPNA